MSFKSYHSDFPIAAELMSGAKTSDTNGTAVRTGSGAFVARVLVNDINFYKPDIGDVYDYDGTPHRYAVYAEANSLESPNTWERVSGSIILGNPGYEYDAATDFDLETQPGEVHHLLIMNPNNHQVRLVLNVEGPDPMLDLTATLHSASHLPA